MAGEIRHKFGVDRDGINGHRERAGIPFTRKRDLMKRGGFHLELAHLDTASAFIRCDLNLVILISRCGRIERIIKCCVVDVLCNAVVYDRFDHLPLCGVADCFTVACEIRTVDRIVLPVTSSV